MNNTEEKRKAEGFPWSIVVFSIAIVIAVGVMVYIQIPHHPEEDYLQERIDNQVNISDEYRLGWNDCIDALRYFNRMVRNATGDLT